jgi:hypothetical protein
MNLPGFSKRQALMAGVLLTALGGMPTSANAWTRIGETPEVTLYVNRQSIEKEDSIRRVWEMQDLKAADADGVMSRRYLNEYDCTYKMHRLGQVTSYAGANERGYWRKIPPNGVFVLTYVAVCVE